MTKSNCDDCVHAKRAEIKCVYEIDGHRYIKHGPGVTACMAKAIKKIDIRGDDFYCSSYEPKKCIGK